MTYRQDHWLIVSRLQEDGDVCLVTTTVACGIAWDPALPTDEQRDTLSFDDGYFKPGEHVQCPACKASQAYQDVITTIELAYDGNAKDWWDARRHELKLGPPP